MQRHAQARSALLLFLTVTAWIASGCSPVIPPPKPLPDLHLPGVTQIPGVTTLHRGVRRGNIVGLATAPSPVSGGTPRAIVAVDEELFSIGFDGDTPQAISTSCPMKRFVIFHASADGRWLFCHAQSLMVLPLPGTSANTVEHALPLQTETGANVEDVADRWTISLDGRYVAVLTSARSQCALALYAVAPTHDAAPLVGQLLLPLSVSVPRLGNCHLSSPVWSPEGPTGTWLAFAHCEGHCTKWAFPLNSYLSRVAAANPQPLNLTVEPQSLHEIAGASRGFSLTWTVASDGVRLNYLSLGIWQMSLTTGETRQLLALPEGVAGGLSALAATPDGHGLVFAHGLWQDTRPECQGGETPSHLYYFTPS